ncbi:MAG: hypothetical protein OXF11_15425 [Deltaproteobacteria bacterium]|nr:hypothetical protein [Deltaproteobacteria bacterium]
MVNLFNCDPAELRHEAVPQRKLMQPRRPRLPTGLSSAPVVAIPEVTVEVSAGPCVRPGDRALALAGEHDPLRG